MIRAERRKALLAQAERLAGQLGSYKTPRTGEAVAPARLAEVMRFLQAHPSHEDLASFLKLMSGSFLSKVSQSAGPQLAEVGRLVGQMAQGLREPEELLFVLGWAQRLLTASQRKNNPEQGGRRGDGPARGPAGGPGRSEGGLRGRGGGAGRAPR